MDGKFRGRRKTNWRTVNLAAYDPVCAGDYDLDEYAPPPRLRPSKARGAAHFDDPVTTRSEWKYMGKQVRKMLIPASISAFASCMWVSFEELQGTSIAAFSRIVELALPFWDALPVDEQEAWAERAVAECRRAHWIYVRGAGAGGGGSMGDSGHACSDARPSHRYRKKQEWDDGYDEEQLSDTDELPSRPTRKLNIDGDDCESVEPKEFKAEEARPAPAHFVGARTVTFKMGHDVEPEPQREPWRERDGMRTVPPPPLTYRPIIVSANPPAQNIPPPSSFYPMQSALRGGYMGRRPARGGFDMYPGLHAMPGASSHAPPLWSGGDAPRGLPLAAPFAFR